MLHIWLFPGGIAQHGFADSYTAFVYAHERNVAVQGVQMSLVAKFLLTVVLAGVSPVPGHAHELADAIAPHHANWDMSAVLRQAAYQDTVVLRTAETEYSVKDLAIERDLLRKVALSGASVSVYGGYYDSGSVVSTDRLQAVLRAHLPAARRKQQSKATVGDAGLQYPLPQHRVVVGPWQHGMRASCSPHAPGFAEGNFKTCFNIWDDVRLFFDMALKRRAHPGFWGDAKEHVHSESAIPSHFFVEGDEEWRHSASWPPTPSTTKPQIWFLSPVLSPQPVRVPHHGTLVRERPQRAATIDVTPMYNTTTSYYSRWNLVQALLRRPVTYATRLVDSAGALALVGPPLDAPVRLLGSPLLTLHMEVFKANGARAADATVFAYLEDVFPDGDVVYVTEGQVLASHTCQQLSNAQGSHNNGEPVIAPAQWDSFCYRTYLQGDRQPLRTQGASSELVHEVRVALLPIAYTFKTGHRLRLVLTGADTHNFLLEGYVHARVHVH